MKHVKPTLTCKPPASPQVIVRFVMEAKLRIALQKNTKAAGTWIRQELISLGPAFIKLGQFVSTRSDLLPKGISKELSQLQDDMEQIDFAEVRHLVEDSIGGVGRFEEVFSEFDTNAIAVASIGQVHRAKLRSNGKQVAVKIQKPCVAEGMRSDMATLQSLSKWMSYVSPRKQEINNVLDQYMQFLSAELDFEQELKNMLMFEKSLSGFPSLRVPKTYSSLSSKYVLIMEYVPSSKINDLALLDKQQIDAKKVAQMLVEAFLYQIVETGIVHCDPHPGNIGVLTSDTLVLYDFGNVVKLDDAFRAEIRNMVFAIYQKDVTAFVDLLIKLRVIQVEDDEERQEINDFFTYFFKYLETLDINTLRTSIQNNELIGQAKGKLKLDPNFIALVRVFSLLDGTCAALDPQFNYIDALMPYAMEFMQDFRFFDYKARKDLAMLQSAPSMMRSTDQGLLRVNRRIKKLDSSMNTMRVMVVASLLGNILQHMHVNDPTLVLGGSLLTLAAVFISAKQER